MQSKAFNGITQNPPYFFRGCMEPPPPNPLFSQILNRPPRLICMYNMK